MYFIFVMYYIFVANNNEKKFDIIDKLHQNYKLIIIKT